MNREIESMRAAMELKRPALEYHPRLKGFFILGFCVVSSALGLVYTTHLNRHLHITLQQLQTNRDTLHVEWTQLLLEQAALSSDARVEKMAREQLGMVTPKANQMMVVSQ